LASHGDKRPRVRSGLDRTIARRRRLHAWLGRTRWPRCRRDIALQQLQNGWQQIAAQQRIAQLTTGASQSKLFEIVRSHQFISSAFDAKLKATGRTNHPSPAK